MTKLDSNFNFFFFFDREDRILLCKGLSKEPSESIQKSGYYSPTPLTYGVQKNVK